MEHTSSRSGLGSSLSPAHLSAGTSSFTDFLRAQAPELLPGGTGRGRTADIRGGEPRQDVPHGTTIVAVTFAGGVLVAGDRRATQGNVIAQRDIEKVFITDDHSSVGIAGTAGLAVEMVRLYAVELQHYEKIEGVSLSLDGKANKLASMVRGNLDAALAGLAVLPLFVGYDVEADDPARGGRIVSFDVTGGRYEERAGFYAIGSGSTYAKSALKKLYAPDSDRDAAVRTAVEALWDAADDDSATGGPDLARRIYPSIVTITAEDGAVRLTDEEIGAVAEAVVRDRFERPRG
ncbi:proteasome subunit beta [Actinokineospora spheciospongiae]|uniref:proteasome subunit beta n=1 Tax=Actinokineospora spheciospongiae TaxID=909613 RepID=UPI000D714FF8|nr:proteasome subunit beta [Actinokineospora spheciospongiae]PWW63055.1 proteasome endopeptidase complex beta subunit [Actinokineospora spheciospongiae]